MSQALMHDVSDERAPAWSPTPVATAAPLVGKGFWHRAASYLLDLPIFYFAMYGLGVTAGPILDYLELMPNLQQALLADSGSSIFLFDLFIGITYFALFEWQFGATPGKVLTGLRVVSCCGEPISLGSAYVRSIARLVDGILFGAVAAASMRAPDQQRLGDKLAGTLVVAVSDPGISRRQPWWRFLFAVVLLWIACMLILCTYLVTQHPVVLGA